MNSRLFIVASLSIAGLYSSATDSATASSARLRDAPLAPCGESYTHGRFSERARMMNCR
jgi:hypothetical protein